MALDALITKLGRGRLGRALIKGFAFLQFYALAPQLIKKAHSSEIFTYNLPYKSISQETGITLVNPNDEDANVNIKAYSDFEVIDQRNLTLHSKTSLSDFVSNLLNAGYSGNLAVNSTLPLIGQETFFFDNSMASVQLNDQDKEIFFP